MLLDFIDDRAEVGFARAGANNKVIGDAGNLADVEDDDVFCLSVVRQIPAEQSEFSGVHCFSISGLKCLKFRKDKGHYGGWFRPLPNRQGDRPEDSRARAREFAKRKGRSGTHGASERGMEPPPGPTLRQAAESREK